MPDHLLPLLLGVHALATVSMGGLIWFIQVVHYPLMAGVGRHEFLSYERLHVRRTTYVVGPLMLTEAATATALLFTPLRDTHAAYLWAGMVLLLIVWVATAAFSVPCHRRLESGHDAATIRRLVATNWIRTVGWSTRAVLAVVLCVS